MPRNTAFLALHYQNEVIQPQGAIRVGMAEDAPGRAALIANARRLLVGMRAASVPVVSVRIAFRPDHADVIANCRIFRDVVRLGAMVEGSWGADFVEGLGPLPGEHVVKHTRTNAFFGSPLEDVLRCLDVRRLVVAGVSTHSVVEATVRHASDAGYAVTVAGDACSSGDAAMHAASLRAMDLVAEVSTTGAILAAL
jgi:nicotinamidase-related amidase